MTDQSRLNYKDYEGLARWASHKIVARAAASGIALDFNDVLQEVALVWINCTEHFDPARGVKFSNYFGRSALHEYHAICRRLLGANFAHTVSLNGPAGGEEDESELGDLVADANAENPETRLIRDEEAGRLLAGNPLLRRLTELAVRPDPEMQAQLDALEAQRGWAAELGVPIDADGRAPTCLTPAMVGRALQFNWRDRRLLNQAYEEAR